MRLFTAIELSEEIKQELKRIQHELKKTVVCRKWQTEAQMHLTLHFLGDFTSEQIEIIKPEIKHTTTSFSPFSLQLKNIGAFPNLKHPRVLWAGIGGQTTELSALQQLLAKRFMEAGLYQEERRYSPHITLGREPNLEGNQLTTHTLPQIHPITWNVDKVTLFHSTLTPTGPIYEIVGTYPLLAKITKEKKKIRAEDKNPSSFSIPAFLLSLFYVWAVRFLLLMF